MEPEETVTIKASEYARLKERDELLSDMEAAGVDNWQGMEEVASIRQEREEVSNG